ncbi:hypothetical protein G9A89_017861 [Geosiphon pyriformis]|nr:hypothetical protein G9A89_017861 [Geosiphon pyriformis]
MEDISLSYNRALRLMIPTAVISEESTTSIDSPSWPEPIHNRPESSASIALDIAHQNLRYSDSIISAVAGFKKMGARNFSNKYLVLPTASQRSSITNIAWEIPNYENLINPPVNIQDVNSLRRGLPELRGIWIALLTLDLLYKIVFVMNVLPLLVELKEKFLIAGLIMIGKEEASSFLIDVNFHDLPRILCLIFIGSYIVLVATLTTILTKNPIYDATHSHDCLTMSITVLSLIVCSVVKMCIGI